MAEEQTILQEMIYEKDYKCPICKQIIKQKMVKASKNKLIEVEFDLNAKYEKTNPLYYEMIVCEVCGFAQLNKRETKLTPLESKLIQEKVCNSFGGRKYSTYYTAEEAVERYKLGLLNAMVRDATEGEKGYIALKIAWVYREIGDEAEEKRFIEEALTCFLNAYQREGFPIFELEEDIVCYLIAALSYQLEDYKQTLDWIQVLLKKKDVSPKLRDRCFVLRQMVKEKQKQQQEQLIE